MVIKNNYINENTRLLIKMALSEDLGYGDITTEPLTPLMKNGSFSMIAFQDFVLAGSALIEAVFKEVDSNLEINFTHEDGQIVAAMHPFATIKGWVPSILMAERTALNFLQRLSGIATKTQIHVKSLMGTGIRLLDTRKTTPGWRTLEKYAVRIGGGNNHRFGLYDSVSIKSNHIVAAGGIEAAVKLIKNKVPVNFKVEVEVSTPEEAKTAVDNGADIILFSSEMDSTELADACIIIKDKIRIKVVTDFEEKMIPTYKQLGISHIAVSTLINNALPITMKLISSN